MTAPEDALDRAREAAARRRSAGGYADTGPGDLSGSIVEGEPSPELLSQWSVIEIDTDDVVYSTRRAGAPITLLKRLLVRLLRQYLFDLEARQTRFNIALLAKVDALEERVARLERERDAR